MRSILTTTLALSLVLASSLNAADPAPGKQVEQSLTTSDGGSIPYLLYQPKDYSATGAKVPFMLFLHGRGESDGPLSVVAKWGPPMRLACSTQAVSSSTSGTLMRLPTSLPRN